MSLKSLFVLLAAGPDGIVQHTFEGRDATLVSSGVAFVPGRYRDEVGASRLGFGLGATRLRDTVVAVSMDGTHLLGAVLDPFARTLVSGPTIVATSGTLEAPGVGADDVGGTVGVCFADGDNPLGGYVGPPRHNPDALRFVLLAPDGTPIGAPVTIASGLHYIAACDVAAAGPDEYVVVFWDAALDGVRPSILAARVTVRR